MCIGFRHRFCRIQTYWFLSKKSINERTLFLSASQLINVPKDFAWTTHRFHFPRCTQPWGTKSSYSSARTACVISRIYLQIWILSTCARMRIHLFQYISYLYLKYICMYTYIVDLQGMVTCFLNLSQRIRVLVLHHVFHTCFSTRQGKESRCSRETLQ